jgi:hypothetical protein
MRVYGGFAGIWQSEIVPMLEAAPGLRAVAIFEELCRRHVTLTFISERRGHSVQRPRMRRISVFAATVLVMSNAEIVAQTLKEWSQCSAGEGKAVDVVIIACSTIIQAGQDGSRRLEPISKSQPRKFCG